MVAQHSAIRIAAVAAFFVLALLVAYLSLGSFPSNAPPGNQVTRMIATLLFGDAAHADKVGHFLAYVTLGVAAVAAAIARRPVWAAPVLLALYGAGLEGVQYFIDGRYADPADAAVNTVGAVVGYMLALGLKKFAARAAP